MIFSLEKCVGIYNFFSSNQYNFNIIPRYSRYTLTCNKSTSIIETTKIIRPSPACELYYFIRRTYKKSTSHKNTHTHCLGSLGTSACYTRGTYPPEHIHSTNRLIMYKTLAPQTPRAVVSNVPKDWFPIVLYMQLCIKIHVNIINYNKLLIIPQFCKSFKRKSWIFEYVYIQIIVNL